MITQKEIKLICSLQQKKYRQAHQLFAVEGTKMVSELIEQTTKRFAIKGIYGTEEWISKHRKQLEKNCILFETITEKELERISSLQAPNQVIAVCHFEEETPTNIPQNSISLGLDHISDPGNLGTIIRIADWFGIDHIYCSKNTVDLYNPKVIQATMGSFLRTQLHYIDLHQLLSKTKLPIYGTFLEGANLHQTALSKNGIIIIGNEGKGISPEIASLITHKINIPSYPHQSFNGNAESLNAAIATAITISEFKRQQPL